MPQHEHDEVYSTCVELVSALLNRTETVRELFPSEREMIEAMSVTWSAIGESLTSTLSKNDGKLKLATLEAWYQLHLSFETYAADTYRMLQYVQKFRKTGATVSAAARIGRMGRKQARDYKKLFIRLKDECQSHSEDFAVIGLPKHRQIPPMAMLLQVTNALAEESGERGHARPWADNIDTVEALKEILGLVASVLSDFPIRNQDSTVPEDSAILDFRRELATTFKHYVTLLRGAGGVARPQRELEEWVRSTTQVEEEEATERGEVTVPYQRQIAIEGAYEFAVSCRQRIADTVRDASAILAKGMMDLALQLVRDMTFNCEKFILGQDPNVGPDETPTISKLHSISKLLQLDFEVVRRICEGVQVAATYQVTDAATLLLELDHNNFRFVRIRLVNQNQKPADGATQQPEVGRNSAPPGGPLHSTARDDAGRTAAEQRTQAAVPSTPGTKRGSLEAKSGGGQLLSSAPPSFFADFQKKLQQDADAQAAAPRLQSCVQSTESSEGDPEPEPEPEPELTDVKQRKTTQKVSLDLVKGAKGVAVRFEKEETVRLPSGQTLSNSARLPSVGSDSCDSGLSSLSRSTGSSTGSSEPGPANDPVAMASSQDSQSSSETSSSTGSEAKSPPAGLPRTSPSIDGSAPAHRLVHGKQLSSQRAAPSPKRMARRSWDASTNAMPAELVAIVPDSVAKGGLEMMLRASAWSRQETETHASGYVLLLDPTTFDGSFLGDILEKLDPDEDVDFDIEQLGPLDVPHACLKMFSCNGLANLRNRQIFERTFSARTHNTLSQHDTVQQTTKDRVEGVHQNSLSICYRVLNRLDVVCRRAVRGETKAEYIREFAQLAFRIVEQVSSMNLAFSQYADFVQRFQEVLGKVRRVVQSLQTAEDAEQAQEAAERGQSRTPPEAATPQRQSSAEKTDSTLDGTMQAWLSPSVDGDDPFSATSAEQTLRATEDQARHLARLAASGDWDAAAALVKDSSDPALARELEMLKQNQIGRVKPEPAPSASHHELLSGGATPQLAGGAAGDLTHNTAGRTAPLEFEQEPFAGHRGTMHGWITICTTTHTWLEETVRDCRYVRELLEEMAQGVSIQEFDMGQKSHAAIRDVMRSHFAAGVTLPQVFFGKYRIGGIAELKKLQETKIGSGPDAKSELEQLLEQFVQQKEYEEVKVEELELQEKLGVGVSGEVRAALWHGNPCAVKLFNPADTTDFRAELGILHQLSHPNVLIFYGAVTKGKQMCLVSERCACSVYQQLQRYGKLSKDSGPSYCPRSHHFLMARGLTQSLLA